MGGVNTDAARAFSADSLAERTERFSASGIPLAEAFRAVLQRLVKGPANLGVLTGEIQANRLLGVNKGRIASTWGDGVNHRGSPSHLEWDDISPANLVRDLLAQLEYLELITRPEGTNRWELTEKFDPSVRYVLVTKKGRPVTHLRLTETLDRVNKGKLADARMSLLAAQRLIREAGVESREIEAFFEGLVRMLASENLEKAERKASGNQPRVITPDQPEDLPNLFVPCTKCGIPQPQTREFYEVYRSKGNWYWRTDCKTCRRKDHIHRDQTGKGKRNKYLDCLDQVRSTVLAFTEEAHYPPTVRQVARRTGVHANSVRKAWKELAMRETDFPPLPEAIRPS
jgi:hypothetical protein